MKFLPGNAQHIGARHEQQDAFAFSNPADKALVSHAGLLAVVSDGMGGLSHGHQASSAAVRAFLAAYEQKSREEAIPAALYRSFQAALAVVQDLNRSATEPGGATIVAAVAHADQLYWISAGDSRLYLIRRGRLVQLSRDHSYRERLLEEVLVDRMSLSEAISHPDREHLTSYLGMAGTPEVDCNVRPFQLEPDDQVVLCTDGVYRNVSERDFVEAFAAGTPSACCGRLGELVLARASQQQDNLTVVALRCAADDAVPSAGWRPKLAVGAACLLFCANLFAADIVWKTLRGRLDVPDTKEAARPKELGPNPSDQEKLAPTPKTAPLPPHVESTGQEPDGGAVTEEVGKDPSGKHKDSHSQKKSSKKVGAAHASSRNR
jgi:protein phosphatase